MRTQGFHTFEELDSLQVDYRVKKWCIAILNAIDVEIEQLFSDKDWEEVHDFSRQLIGENFSGEIARQIHIYGDPNLASENHRSQFLPSNKPWRNYFHFQIS